MSKRLHQVVVAGVVFTAGVGVVHAQAEDASPNIFSIGAGVAFGPRYPGSSSVDTLAVPMLNIVHEVAPRSTVYLQGLGAGYAYQATDKLKVGLHARYRGERETDDDVELYGLPKVDRTLEMGPRVSYQINDAYGVEGQMLWDAGDAYNGYTARVGGTYKQPLSERLFFNAGAGVNYGDKKFAKAYYGVPSGAVALGRPAYTPGSGLTHLDARAGLTYMVNTHWSVTGGVGADYLVGDVADSPIVQQELQPGMLVGVSYRF